MSKKNDCWGIEVGANAIKAVRLAREGGNVQLVEYDVLPFKTILSTPDLNIDEAVQLNLDQFMSRHDMKNSRVVVSIPGHMAFARFAKLPPVDPKTIPKMVEFEAKQQIPFPIEQVEWDYQVFQQEDSPDVEVGIFAITKDRVLDYLSNFRHVGVPVDGLTLSPLAVYNAMAYDLKMTPQSPGIMFVDVGTSSTDVIIVENGQVWLRTLPIGGNNFTQALIRQFKLSFPKAEKLKREAATSKYARQIFQAMRPVFADMVQEMQKTLGYYKTLNREAQINTLMGFGSTFRLPGLQKFLKQQLQMEVLRPEGYKRITVEGRNASEFAEQSLNLTTAYGLALQGLDEEKVSANLLPSYVLKQRLWKGKQPWFAAAAALALAATGLAYGTLKMQENAWKSENRLVSSRVSEVTTEAERFKARWTEIQQDSDPRQRIENLRRILDYRDIWAKVMEDLALATQSLDPQPETLEADYEKMALVPRKDRRRIYIETMTANYEFTVSSTTPGQPQGTAQPSSPWGGYEAPGPDGAPAAAQQQASGATKPPRFTITITGTTTYERPSDLLKLFVNWFKQNAKHEGRPYHIVPDSPTLVNIKTMETDDKTRRLGPERTQFDPGVRRPAYENPELSRTQPLQRRGTPATPQRRGDPATTARTPSGKQDAASLLPQRPLLEEDPQYDRHFTVRWTIQTVDPQASRAAEAGAPPADPNAPQEPQPQDPAQPQQPDAPAAPDTTAAQTEPKEGQS